MKPGQVIDKLRSSGDVPTIGVVATEVIRLASDPDCDFQTLGRIIERDPALTVKLLKLANSTYYGMSGRVASVELAIVLLGMTEVRNLVLSVSVISNISTSRLGSRAFDWEAFWEHSAGCALVSQSLVRLLELPSEGEEYVAGLLHDVGKILLGHHFPNEFAEATNLARQMGLTSEVAEQRVFGTDHGSIGDWLAARWSLPSTIRDAIAHHHHPERALEGAILASVVSLADALTRAKRVSFADGGAGICLADTAAWQLMLAARPELADVDVERFTFELDREVAAARELARIAKAA